MKKPSKINREKAIEFYAMARKLEAEGDYEAAWKYYEQSLALHEDEVIKKAYLRFLAAVGPM